MKVTILSNKDRKVVSIFATTVIKNKNYYCKFNKKGWLELEYVGDNPTLIPAFLEMPDSIAQDFLIQMALALGRYGIFARPKKKTLMERIKNVISR